MSIARELERRLERLVGGISAVLFRGALHPVEVAARIVREADLKIVEGALGPEIPNAWTLTMAPEDLVEAGADSLAVELTAVLETSAAERGWRTGGPLGVTIVADDDVKSGSVRVRAARSSTGDSRPWAQLLDAEGGGSLEIADNRVLVGRSAQADVRVEDPAVSRRHAVVFRQDGRTWLVDAGSANGTYVNSAEVGTTPVAVQPGDLVSFGTATFTFRLH